MNSIQAMATLERRPWCSAIGPEALQGRRNAFLVFGPWGLRLSRKRQQWATSWINASNDIIGAPECTPLQLGGVAVRAFLRTPLQIFAAWRRTPLQLGFVAVGAVLCTPLQLGGVTAVGAFLCTSLRLCSTGGLALYTFAAGRHWQWEPSFVHLCSFATPQWELLFVHPCSFVVWREFSRQWEPFFALATVAW